MADTRDDGWTRREFTAASVMALLAGVSVTISACGGGGGGGGGVGSGGTSSADQYGPTGPSGLAEQGDALGSISENHGHSAVVRAAQLAAPGAVSLNIQAAATHNHVVSLSSDEVRSIAAGGRVIKQSTTTEAHAHNVTFN